MLASRKRPNWSRPLSRPIVIPDIMTLKSSQTSASCLSTCRPHIVKKATWRYVADRLDDAAHGADVIDLVMPLRMVLSMEGIACRPK